MEFFTIGVYNSTEKQFFDKLLQNNIDTFCDIRQRRGVRGSKYSFVNSNRLQEKLKELDIKYGHVQGLAPTLEIRETQKNIDAVKGVSKIERQELGQIFVIEYKNKVLNKFDFDIFFENLENVGSKRVVLFCVEETAKACHRSIVATKLKDKYSFNITDL
jgi:uncharacterized protein (DUF488 family)